MHLCSLLCRVFRLHRFQNAAHGILAHLRHYLCLLQTKRLIFKVKLNLHRVRLRVLQHRRLEILHLVLRLFVFRHHSVRVIHRNGDRHRGHNAQLVFHSGKIHTGRLYGLGHTTATLFLQALKVLCHFVVKLRGVLVKQLAVSLVLRGNLPCGIKPAGVFVNRF